VWIFFNSFAASFLDTAVFKLTRYKIEIRDTVNGETTVSCTSCRD